MNQKYLTIAFAALLAVILATPAQAQLHNWLNPIDGAFSDGSNWDAGVPGAAATAVFNVAGGYNVTIDNDIQVGGFQHLLGGVKYNGGHILKVDSTPVISDGEARFQNNGTEFQSTQSLFIAGLNNPTLALDDNAAVFITDRLIVAGGGVGTSNTGTVDVNDSDLIAGDSLQIGFHGEGNLDVSNGGRAVTQSSMVLAVASGSEGNVTVSGNGSAIEVNSHLHVGSNGDATFVVSSGATTESANARIATSSGTIASATVTGPNSEWTSSGTLDVGFNGEGTLNIDNQGSVSSSSSDIGMVDGSGTVNIADEGSEFRVANNIQFGNSAGDGKGFLNLSNGGDLFVGDNAPGSNSSSNIYVSDSSGATLRVLNNSAISNPGETYIGYSNGNIGGVTINDAVFNNSGTIRVGFVGNGVLDIENGGSVTTGSLLISTNINSRGEVNVDGGGSSLVSGNLWVGTREDGEMNVTDGGFVKCSTGFVAGLGGIGEAIIDGVDSRWDSRNLSVGSAGSDGVGSVFAQNGGRIYVGDDTSPVASLVVSDFGSAGTLNIANGSSVTSDDGVLMGFSTGTSAEVNISGAGSTLNFDDSMYVGTLGSATLNLMDGGTAMAMSPTAFAYISPLSEISLFDCDIDAGNQLINEGTLTGEDGICMVSGSVVMNNAGTIHVKPNVRLVLNDSVTDDGLAPFLVEAGGELYFQDAYTGKADIDGPSGQTFFSSELSLAGIGERAAINVEGSVILDSANEWVLDLEGTNAHDAMTIDGELKLGGSLTLNPINGFQFAPGQEFIISKVNVALTGQFNGVTSGEMLTQFGNVGVFVDYAGNDGNDLVLYTELVPDVVLPDTWQVTRGTYVSGGIAELSNSDNQDVSIRRSNTDIQSRTEFEIKSFSTTANPTFMELELEGSVFARTNVRQFIELFNYDTGMYEQLDVRNASRFADSTTTVEVTGDLSRFVENGTNGMLARIRYLSDNPRQQFASNTDRFNWLIAE